MARTVIVGAGIVGTATGKGFALAGHSVSFVDVNPRRVETLRAEGFAVSNRIDLSGPGAYVFLTVPTPNDGYRYDLSALEAATAGVGAALRDATSYHTVVVRSTVPPGTCEGRVRRLLEETSGRRSGEDFGLASNPEFLRAASAREDFLMPWMTVIGSRSRRTVERLVELYRPFGGQIKTFSDPAEAELAKCAHNLFNATKISFWNEMWLVARTLGIPVDGVARTVAYSAEGSLNPEYGIRAGSAYGGACLPKDAKGFLGFAAELGLEMPMLAGVIRVNEIMAGEPGADLVPRPPRFARLPAPQQDSKGSEAQNSQPEGSRSVDGEAGRTFPVGALAVEAHALAAGAEVHELPRNGGGHGNGRK